MGLQRSVVGVDLGGTRIKAGLVDGDGHIHSRYGCGSGQGYDELIDRLGDAVEQVDPEGAAEAIGLGSPGPLDPATGSVLEAPNVPGLAHQPLVADMESRCGRPVYLENDANVAALGESWIGRGRGAKSLIVITVGTGVGGGIVLDGRLWAGCAHAAGEIGHMCMDPSGPRCGCGSRGCLETYLAGPAIAGRAAQELREGASSSLVDGSAGRGIEDVTAEAVARACENNDAVSVRVMEEAGEWLGIACANLVHLMAPEVILVGGGVSAAGDLLLEPARKAMNARVFKAPAAAVRLERAGLGNDAGLVGAARHAWDGLGH